MATVKLDWINLEREYVQGYWQKLSDGTKKLVYPTIEELAQKYNCHPQSIYAKSSQDKWLNKRELFWRKLKNQIIENDNAGISDSVKYDVQNLLRIEKIGELIDRWLKERLSEDEEGNRPVVEPKELSCLLDALTKSHQLARNIFGEENDKAKFPKISNSVQINKKELNIIDAPTLDNLIEIIQSRREKLKSIYPHYDS